MDAHCVGKGLRQVTTMSTHKRWTAQPTALLKLCLHDARKFVNAGSRPDFVDLNTIMSKTSV